MYWVVVIKLTGSNCHSAGCITLQDSETSWLCRVIDGLAEYNGNNYSSTFCQQAKVWHCKPSECDVLPCLTSVTLVFMFTENVEMDIVWPEKRQTVLRLHSTAMCLILLPLHYDYVTVRCRLTSSSVLGEFFFEEIPCGPVKCTVTAARNRDHLVRDVILRLKEWNCVDNTILFQDNVWPRVIWQMKGVHWETLTMATSSLGTFEMYSLLEPLS